jgi:hypothetical protein
MTQDELNLVLDALKWCHGGEPCGTAEAIAVVEKALAQPEQEPVAYVNVEKRRLEFAEPMVWHTPTVVNLERIPLYTQQRTWSGLTDDEIEVLFQTAAGADEEVHIRFARAVESKLKEVNT